MADLKYMEKQVYDVSLGTDVYKVYVSLNGPSAVAGPATVVDDNVATWNGTSGELLQDSGIAVADLEELTGGSDTTLHSHAYDANLTELTDGSETTLHSHALWDGHTELSDTAYTDLVVSPAVFQLPVSSYPTEITWLTNLKAYSFATGEYVYLDGVQLPHGYVPGTDLLPHVHFVPAADITDGEVVRFTLTYTIASPFYGFPATATVTTDFTNSSAWRAGLSAGQSAAILSGTTVVATNNPHLITTSGTIDGTNLAISSVLSGRLAYTATGTTYTGEAIVTSIDFHYQVNRFGSENEFTG